MAIADATLDRLREIAELCAAGSECSCPAYDHSDECEDRWETFAEICTPAIALELLDTITELQARLVEAESVGLYTERDTLRREWDAANARIAKLRIAIGKLAGFDVRLSQEQRNLQAAEYLATDDALAARPPETK